MKAPITQAQAWAWISESAGWDVATKLEQSQAERIAELERESETHAKAYGLAIVERDNLRHELKTAQEGWRCECSTDDACRFARERDAKAERIKELESECEVERLRLAACGVAALGYFDGCKDEYKSASLDDVLRLNKRCTDLHTQLAEIDSAEPVAWTTQKHGIRHLTTNCDIAASEGYDTPLYTRPMPAQPADHEVRELVNRLTAIAKEFNVAQQLRERIANEIRPFTLVMPAQDVRDAERYQWLREYMISSATVYDDLIVAADSSASFDRVIDTALANAKGAK